MSWRSAPHLRIARPSLDLDASRRFYVEGLGLQLLFSFEDHAGFDGMIIGHPTWPYHLEFTRNRRVSVRPAPSNEDLLILYLPLGDEWERAVARLREFGAREIAASNPYWNLQGVTFVDPDGYGIVLQNASWP